MNRPSFHCSLPAQYPHWQPTNNFTLVKAKAPKQLDELPCESHDDFGSDSLEPSQVPLRREKKKVRKLIIPEPLMCSPSLLWTVDVSLLAGVDDTAPNRVLCLRRCSPLICSYRLLFTASTRLWRMGENLANAHYSAINCLFFPHTRCRGEVGAGEWDTGVSPASLSILGRRHNRFTSQI